MGQVHGGLMGVLQRAMVRSCPHVWFERAEMKDRHLVTKRSAYFHPSALSVVFMLVVARLSHRFFLSVIKRSWPALVSICYYPSMNRFRKLLLNCDS